MIQALPSQAPPLPFATELHHGTDSTWKTHAFVVLKGLLFLIGAAFLAAPFLLPHVPLSVAAGGAPLPLVLALLIPTAKADADPSATSAPDLLPGQPVGIKRPGMNCWLISTLQLLCNIPAYKNQMELLDPEGYFYPFAKAFQCYQSDQASGKVSAVDSQELRLSLHDLIPQPQFSRDLYSQDDPWDVLSYFCNCLGLKQHTHYPNEAADLQEFYQRWGVGAATEEFTVNVVRGDTRVRLDTKLQNAMHLRINEGNFDCDGFIVHLGSSTSAGHYVAYVHKLGHWWELNDHHVKKISEERAMSALENASILHYQKS